jgi:O-antigen ligase
MMAERVRKLLWMAEFGALLALALVLPMFEALKNIFCLLYVLLWLVNRVVRGECGGRWTAWDSLIVFWVGGAYLCAYFSGMQKNEWGDTGELAMYVLVLWLVLRGGYSAKEQRMVLGVLVASTVIGLVQGYYYLYVTHRRQALQLHSVGHVNHSAIYIAIVLGVCASWLFAYWRSWLPGRRAAATSILLLLLVSLVWTESRAAVGVGLLLLVVLSAAWWPRWRAPLLASLAAVAVVVAVAVAMGAGVVRKQVERTAAGDFLQLRDAIWRTGIATWERYPWFGVGKDNFGLVTRADLRRWHEEAGKPYDDARFVPYNHAHNLYVNTLAERGLVGFAGLMAVLAAWAVALVRRRPRAADSDLAWLLWGGALSAWVVTCGVGVANTTLHHEHGILAALLLGLWLSSLPRRAS